MFTTATMTAPLPLRRIARPSQSLRRSYWRPVGSSVPHFDATKQPLVVSIPEACALLRVSKWSLYQLIRSGRLETVKIGSRRLIPVTALYELLTKLGSGGDW